MRRNLRDAVGSERLLAALAPVMGKHRAQARLQELFAAARSSDTDPAEVIGGAPDVREALGADRLAELLGGVDTGSSGAMVDEVVARAEAARTGERS
jgi:hypothetical protein